jgi:large subunit ribosomal protein L9
MQMILLKKVKTLGDLGEIVNVKPGYGRNFLLPQGIALPASDKNREVFEARKAELVRLSSESLAAAKIRAQAYEGLNVTVRTLAAEGGKLYGAITVSDVVRAAAAQGVELVKTELHLPVIRNTGAYKAHIRLHAEVDVEIDVTVASNKG